jgi:hypothetical protein
MDIPRQASEQEKHFEHLIPMKSALGREFLALQAERDKHRRIFEIEPHKMSADTLSYRRSEIALGRFLDDMIPLVMDYLEKLKTAGPGLARAEESAYQPMWGKPLHIDRGSEIIIWTRFAIERYRATLPAVLRKKARAYHPVLWKELGCAWKEFRKEIRDWKNGRQPFDGSQAMHLMIAFQVKVRLLACAND